MTRSIFDPEGGETERSGNRFTQPDADQISQMPPDVVDGKVEPEELADHGETVDQNGEPLDEEFDKEARTKNDPTPQTDA